MKEVKLSIEIKKPAKVIFEFTLNPENTPKWIDFIIKEETNEWPAKLGTRYRNHGVAVNDCSEFEVTEFEPYSSFTLSKNDGSYHVRYVFTPVATDITKFDYYEWTDKGDLADPFTLKHLQKLKLIIEE